MKRAGVGNADKRYASPKPPLRRARPAYGVSKVVVRKAAESFTTLTMACAPILGCEANQRCGDSDNPLGV